MIVQNADQAVLDNTAFVQKVVTNEGLEKMAGIATDFCRVKIREGSFARKITA